MRSVLPPRGAGGRAEDTDLWWPRGIYSQQCDPPVDGPRNASRITGISTRMRRWKYAPLRPPGGLATGRFMPPLLPVLPSERACHPGADVDPKHEVDREEGNE